MSRFKRGNKSIYNINYHIIWIPKYRRKILTGDIKNTIEKTNELNIKLEKLEIMPDHIHIFVRCNPNISVSELVKQLKGYSSYKARNKHSELSNKKHLWSPSYYCESIGHISEETIKKYIEDQWKTFDISSK